MSRENRAWWVREWHFDAMVESFGDAAELVWQACMDADPSSNGKYLKWIVGQVLRGQLNADAVQVRELLAQYDRCKSALSLPYRNIDNFKDYNALRATVDAATPRLTKRAAYRSELEALEECGALETLYRGPEGSICAPRSHDAMRLLGRGTKWCVAAEDSTWFNEYWSRGPGGLTVLLPKKGRKKLVFLPQGDFFGPNNRPLRFEEVRHDALFERLGERPQFQLALASSQRPLALAYFDSVVADAASLAARRVAEVSFADVPGLELLQLKDEPILIRRFLALLHRHFSRLELAYLIGLFGGLLDNECRAVLTNERAVGAETFSIAAARYASVVRGAEVNQVLA